MKVITVRGATGRADTDLMGKFQAARNALLQGFDFVLVHVKAADSFSHDGDPQGKKEFIQRVDAAMSLWLQMPEVLLVTTADHSSPCELKAHSGDPVPLMMSGSGVRRDSVRQFGERECAKGGIGRIKGTDLLPEIVNVCGRAQMYGA
jgi:2,3-bisphosphoglycerate-independent phosphoglycerate mutase